jgi:transposase InsO family protein
LRRELGLKAKRRRKARPTTDSSHQQPVAPNLLRRRFEASRPDEIWVGDLTYLTTPDGWLYLALLMDIYSRLVVGWSLSERIDEELTLSALRQALETRGSVRGVVHHTDRGGQYCGNLYRKTLDKAGIVASMSRRGDCWDNAMAESLIKTIKIEAGSEFADFETARSQLFQYIEGFYNTRRLHSSIGFRPPAELERLAAAPADHHADAGLPVPQPPLGGLARPQTAEPAFPPPAPLLLS